jgi:hypothetical protein
MTTPLKITGLIFILIGLAACVMTVRDVMAGVLFINIFVLCLFVGIGLLRNKESSKRWGRLWTWVLFLIGIFFVGTVVSGMATIFNFTVKDGLIYCVLGLSVTIPLMFGPLFMNRAIVLSH